MRTSHLGVSGMKKRRGRIIREGIEPVQSQKAKPSVQLLCFGPQREKEKVRLFLHLMRSDLIYIPKMARLRQATTVPSA